MAAIDDDFAFPAFDVIAPIPDSLQQRHTNLVIAHHTALRNNKASPLPIYRQIYADYVALRRAALDVSDDCEVNLHYNQNHLMVRQFDFCNESSQISTESMRFGPTQRTFDYNRALISRIVWSRIILDKDYQREDGSHVYSYRTHAIYDIFQSKFVYEYVITAEMHWRSSAPETIDIDHCPTSTDFRLQVTCTFVSICVCCFIELFNHCEVRAHKFQNCDSGCTREFAKITSDTSYLDSRHACQQHHFECHLKLMRQDQINKFLQSLRV